MKRAISIIIFLLIVGAIGATLIPTDRNQIKKVIDSSKTAVLNGDVSGFMENVSFNYSDDSGNSYLLLKKRMDRLLGRFRDFDISTDILSVAIDKDTAEADLKVSVIASDGDAREYLVGDAAWPQDVKVFFEKSPSLQWKLMRVEQVDQSMTINKE